jgi:hypothetical protein
MSTIDEMRRIAKSMREMSEYEFDPEVHNLECAIDTLAAEVDELREREIKVSVLVDNEAPFFGAFWSEERDGCFGIIINLKNCAGLAESEEMFAKTVQDTLAHELLHAVQAAYGQMFSETQVREALEDPATLECAEDSEQMIQQMMNDFMEVQDNLIQARAELARVKAESLRVVPDGEAYSMDDVDIWRCVDNMLGLYMYEKELLLCDDGTGLATPVRIKRWEAE